jgi:hypothetical protein
MHTLTTEELVEQFEKATLPADLFRHEDHLRAAFHYLREYPLLHVLERFPAALLRFATANGKSGLYHQTITWVLLLLIHERMHRTQDKQTWEQFAAANKDLLNWKENVLAKYYRKETLASDLSRAVFLLPDKLTDSD